MARVAGIDLPREKRGEVALTYIYGVGTQTALRVLEEARVDPNKRVKAWDEAETARVRDMIERELKDLSGRQQKIGKVTRDIATGKNEAK